MAKRDYSSWSKKELIERIHALEKRKKYGLLWDVDRELENVVLESANSLPVFAEVPEKDITNKPGEKPHILIEGDNYHALSVLNYTHRKAIDVIYIDPPYNTGAEDWKYNNNYVDKEDGYRHSKWLSFMNNRLRLAKNLLKSEGVLICAIDENEQERIGLLLENIFPSHEKTCVTIIHNPGGIQGDNFSYCHEYAYFVFPKGGTYIGKVIRDNEDIIPLRDWGGYESKRETSKNGFYPIIIRDGEPAEITKFGEVCAENWHPKAANVRNKDGTLSIYPIDNDGVERKWRFARQSVEKIKENLFVEVIKGEYVVKRRKSEYRYKTVWTDKKYNSNAYGSNLLNRILDKKFPFPKSLYNVKECLDAVIRNKKNAIVLDYFAGSGTTAHALLEMNRLDNGNRRFILCTNNEGNICEEVCYPRIEKIMNGYESKAKMRSLLFDFKFSYRDLQNAPDIIIEIEAIKKQQENNFDYFDAKFEDDTVKLFGVNSKGQKINGFSGNLIYYKTAFVPAEPTDKNKETLTKQSVEMLCLRENTFDFMKETKIWKLYRNKQRHTGILFDQMQISAFKKELNKLDTAVSVYVFSLGDDNFADDFADMKNVKVCSIPEAILRVYRKIFK